MVKVIVGLMGSSVAHGSPALSTPSGLRELLAVAKRYGVEEVDTARVYADGRSEELLGEVGAAQTLLIATKAPAFAPGSLQFDKILANFKASSNALRASSIDIYYIHGPDAETPVQETARAFVQLYREGHYRRFGVSNISPTVVEELHNFCIKEKSAPPSVYQGAYSPIHRSIESELLPRIRELGMAYYAWAPLAGGLLAKPIDQILNPTKGSRYDLMKAEFGPWYLKEGILMPLKALSSECQQKGIPLAEATLRWHMHHSALGENDGIILGASSAAQLETTLKACQGGPLSQDLLDAYDSLWKAIEPCAPPAWL